MIHVIVKGTKTIEEYKQVKATMEALADEFSKKHMSAEKWNHGEPLKAWYDCNQHLCIEYSDGFLFLYNEKGEWS